MTRDVFVIGVSTTPFGKAPERGFKDLTRESYLAVLADAGLDRGESIEQAWFGNCGMGSFGQANIRGQVCLTPLVREGLFPERVPTINVEGGCATASMAFHGAWKDVLSGQTRCSLAIGVEKTFVPGQPEKSYELFAGGIDQLDPEEWQRHYAEIGEKLGKRFEAGGDRSIFMDTYAMQALHHMKRWGTSQRQIACAAAKSHSNGALNPNAQYRFELTVEEVLADREISYPLTRAMCAPIGDGAAAALLCSQDFLGGLPARTRERAVRVRASALSGGKYRELDEPSLSHVAAQRAYAQAGIGPGDVDFAELHDATSFCELYQLEMLGFCEPGRSGAFVEAGETARDGALPVNPSGGLVSKGHPVGATGLSMIHELVTQLRGEAGARQLPAARIGLAENGGGVIGFEEAACCITILEARS